MAQEKQNSTAGRRLMRDYCRLQRESPEGINAQPRENNLFIWDALMFGPKGSELEYGTFRLRLTFPITYPFRPPTVHFVTRMFHPNVYNDGKVCLDLLGKQWVPAYDVMAVLTSVQALLVNPNPNSPANAEAAKLFIENRVEYCKRVSRFVEESIENEANGGKQSEDRS